MAELSEAQILVDRMMAAGMQPFEIAKLIGVRSQQIRDIKRRKSLGRAYADQLRVVAAGVAESVPVASDTSDGHSLGESLGMSTPTASTRDHATATIDAEEAPRDERSTFDKAKDRIKEMILGGGDQPSILASAPRKSSGSGGDKRGDFVDQAVPLLALVVSMGGDMLIRDPYKPCAPNDEEAAALVRPWVRIVSRQLEIAGRLTETQLDILGAMMASAIYGRRAWKTYKAIREQIGENSSNGQYASNGAGSADHRGTTPAPRDSGAGRPADSGRTYSPLAAAIRTVPSTDSADSRRIDSRFVGAQRSGDEIIVGLYQRDAELRRAAGLE